MTNLLKNKLTNEKIDKLIDEIWCAGYNIGANNGDDVNTEFIKVMKSEFLALIHQAEIKARIDEISRWFDLPRHYKGEEYRDEPFVKVKCKTPKMTRYQLLDINFTWAVLDRISALEKEIINE